MAKIKKTGRHTGAIKAARQAHRRMLRNRTARRRIRAVAKTYIEAARKKDSGKLQELLPQVASFWDKAAKTGAIHWKAAARKKARLSLLARKIQTAPVPAAKA